jgi:hypothetical protein
MGEQGLQRTCLQRAPVSSSAENKGYHYLVSFQAI